MTNELRVEVAVQDRQAAEAIMGGSALRNTEVQLADGVRLRFDGSQSPSRGAQGLEILMFALNVPLSVASSVAAGMIMKRLTRAKNIETMTVVAAGGRIAIKEVNSPEGDRTLTAAIEEGRISITRP